MTRLLLLIAALTATLGVTGCGQKGPLYLPGNPSAVQISPEPQQQESAAESDADDDEDKDENGADER